MAGEFVAGAIVSKLILDTKKWSTSVSKVNADQKNMLGMSQKMSKGFRTAGIAMTAAGGAIIGTLGAMAAKFVETGDWIDKMSKRTGISATALSELSYAADISGASLGDAEKSIKKMAKSITDADAGLMTYTREFDRLGLDIQKLKKLSPEKQFLVIGEAINQLSSETEKAATAQMIFGRSGTTLLPLFKEGSAGIAELRQEAQRLGIVMDQEAAAKAAALKDAQTALTASMKGLTLEIAGAVVPMITDLVTKVTDIIVKVREWATQNPALFSTIVKVAGALGGLLTVFGPILIMLPRLVAGIKLLGSGIGKLAGGPLGTLGAIAAAAFAGWNIGKRIGEVKILGKSINEHLVGAFESLTDKIMGLNKEQEKTEGAMSAQEKRTRMLAEASKIAGREITWIGDAQKILAGNLDEVNEKEKARLAAIEKAKEKDEEEKDAVDDLVDAMTTYQATLTGVEGKIKAFAAETQDAINTNEDFDAALDLLKSTMEEQVRPATETVIDGIALLRGETLGYKDDQSDVQTFVNDSWDAIIEKQKDVPEEARTSSEATKTIWGEAADGLVTKWSESIGEWIASLDIFRGDFQGLADSMVSILTDTVGQLISTFINGFIKKALSGVGELAGSIGSSIGSAFGGGGVSSVADGISGVVSQVGSLVSPVGAIANAIGGIANLASSLFGGGGGMGTTEKWHLEHIWISTKEARDYLFIEQWKMLQYGIEQRHLAQETLWKQNEKLTTMRTILKEIRNSSQNTAKNTAGILKKTGKAQHGAIHTSPGFFAVGEEAPRIPEVTMPIPDLAQMMHSGVQRSQVFLVIGNRTEELDMTEGVQQIMINASPELTRQGRMKINMNALVKER